LNGRRRYVPWVAAPITLPACCAEPMRRCAFRMRRFASETRMGARCEVGLFAHSRRKMSAASALRQVDLFSRIRRASGARDYSEPSRVKRGRAMPRQGHWLRMASLSRLADIFLLIRSTLPRTSRRSAPNMRTGAADNAHFALDFREGDVLQYRCLRKGCCE